MRIDLHAHLFLPRFCNAAAGHLPPLPPATIEDLLAEMERYSIQASVVSLPFVIPQDRAAPVARVANEELAELISAHPREFGALAMIPLSNEELALAELEHALDVLGLDGVALLSNAYGRYLGDDSYDALFAELDRRGCYVLVHPGAPPYSFPLPQYSVAQFEYPFETTRALAHLAYTGALERFPRIRFQFGHLGGAFPFIAHRIAMVGERDPALASVDLLGLTGNVYFDTGLANQIVPLRTVLELVPLDRVVFGTDWPFLSWTDDRDVAPGLAGLGPAVRERIDGRNAAALVPRLAGA